MTITIADGRGALWQWDTGRRVKVDGGGVEQVHYQNRCFGATIDVDVGTDGTAIIPDELLQDWHPITVYAYTTDDTGGYTEVQQVLPVHKRAKPADYVYTPTEQKTLKDMQRQIGDLSELETEAKDTLVAAINEAARTGGGAGSMELRVADGYIQYSTDGGRTWQNLIAVADLKGNKGDKGEKGDAGAKGDPGEKGDAGAPGAKGDKGDPGTPGKDGTPGADGYSPTAKVEETADGAKITIEDKTGVTEAEVKNGKDGTDGAPGKDGADGAPGKDGTNGITPTIGDNGNWYLGDTDTGRPSRGEKGDTGDTGPQGPAGQDGKDGAGMDITGATVGQIAKITAVDTDGKPTAWEAVDMPSGEGETWELLKDITTEEAVAALNFDLGKECSEVCVFISGKWVTGLTSPFVVINMCSNDSYSEIGQKNVVYETASFYANNVRTVIADCSMLSPGFWKVVAADNVPPSPSKITSYNAKFGSNSVGTFPNRCRYLHIGTHNSTHQYEAGLVVKIWGK